VTKASALDQESHRQALNNAIDGLGPNDLDTPEPGDAERARRAGWRRFRQTSHPRY
jgi:hypothetical protein